MEPCRILMVTGFLWVLIWVLTVQQMSVGAELLKAFKLETESGVIQSLADCFANGNNATRERSVRNAVKLNSAVIG